MSEIDRLRSKIDPRYALDREIGAGGMATVYLARDAKHSRKIAIKVLRTELAASLAAERFHREIEVAAQLQHPHILPLLDSGEVDGTLYYLMPFVEGESLRERLSKHGELPVQEAVRILIEVVDALAYAHSRGVVHRDIKPDNVLLSGRHALVTDFGVAKAVSEATGRQKLTTLGVALGTPQYMAPEQATADPHVDQRADIYAVGCMAYELLTGRPPFAGLTPQETLAAHLTVAPEPVATQRAAINPGLSAVVMRCLEKRAADRWQSADDLLAQLEPHLTPSTGTTPTSTPPAKAATRRVKLGLVIGASAGVVFLAAIAMTMVRDEAAALTIGRAIPLTAEPGLEIEPSLSPDGNYVAYAAGNLNATRVYVRQARGRPIAITPDSGPVQRGPLWSPDGSNQLLFLQGEALVVTPALGGTPRVVVRDAQDRPVVSAAWSPDGKSTAYVVANSLYVKPLAGGDPRLLANATQMFGVSWSPDGSHIAYAVGDARFSTGNMMQFGNLAPSEIRVVAVQTGREEVVTDGASLNVSPVWMPDSRTILFVSDRDGPRDIYSARFGSASSRKKPVRITTGLNAHSIALSADGNHITYSVFSARSNIFAIPMLGGGGDARQLTSGNQTIETVFLSKDGKRLYFDSDLRGNSDLYRMTLPAGEPEQLTTDPAAEFNARESENGRWVAYHSWKHGSRDVFVMRADGGEPTRVTYGSTHEWLPHWSPDGNSLSYTLGADRERIGVYVTHRQSNGSWSPGRMLAPGDAAAWYSDSALIALVAGRLELRSIAGQSLGLFAVVGDTARVSVPVIRGAAAYYKVAHTNGASSWWVVDRRGAKPRMIARWSDPSRPSNRLEFGTDGTYIYTALVDRQSDVFVADLGRP